ncbi:UNVERIFIED_CONTAM: hypothetical protein RF648_04935 [Kocuria sp. CPCC 205274]
MDQHASAAGESAPQSVDTLIPTAGQVIVRALPACAVAIISIPFLAYFLPPNAAEQRTPWLLLILLATIGLAGIVYHSTKAPRPRADERVLQAQWKRAFASAAASGSLPPHADVRVAAGVAACNVIEGFMLMASALLGTLICAFIRPELSWWDGGVIVLLTMAVISAFRLRGGWAYLNVLRVDVHAR